jgi:hypothetical protein
VTHEPQPPSGAPVVAPEPLPPPVPSFPSLPARRRPRWALPVAVLVALVIIGLAVARLGGPSRPPVPEATGGEVAEVPATAAPALAETVGEEGHLAIGVVSLDRVGPDMVELRLAVTNTSAAGAPALDVSQRFSADGPDRGTLAEIYLADLTHQRKFFILRDAQNAPIGSRDTAPLPAGERRVFWARYPAPDADDREVVVHVPHADPMPNVPVGQRTATP